MPVAPCCISPEDDNGRVVMKHNIKAAEYFLGKTGIGVTPIGLGTWQFAGGQDLAAFRKLAIWVMRNPDSTGSFTTGLGMICAAWAYGEPELAASLLEAYEAQWEEQLSDRAYDVLPDARAKLHGEFGRLRGIIGLSAKGR